MYGVKRGGQHLLRFARLESKARFLHASAPRFNNVTVNVNGKDIDVPGGATVLHACEEAGVDIPRFCYHDRLSIAGNCRMCLVEGIFPAFCIVEFRACTLFFKQQAAVACASTFLLLTSTSSPLLCPDMQWFPQKVEKSPKPVASCAMPLMPGMKIKTDTPLVHKAREGYEGHRLSSPPAYCHTCLTFLCHGQCDGILAGQSPVGLPHLRPGDKREVEI
jgi:NADH dehydrogenase (ubiquinone) Fe-S protein 1